MAQRQNMIRLDSKNTTYIMRINEAGHLENLYYGRKLRQDAKVEALLPKREIAIGTGVAYNEENPLLFLETACLEVGTQGKGDYRSPSIVIEYSSQALEEPSNHQKENVSRIATTGMQTLDFVYKAHRIIKGKPCYLEHFAQSYATEEEATTLEILLEDTELQIELQLNYTVFHNCDTIARSATVTNKTNANVLIKNIASLQLDLPPLENSNEYWNVVSFDGAWARERETTRQILKSGKLEFCSTLGVSGASHNPCFFLENPACTANHGSCYAFNLIYSGNHREVIELSTYGNLRVQTGINPESFTWNLKPQDSFTTPEAVMTFSCFGNNGASENFHNFVNNHIVRGFWKFRDRPILCNNWEATYFNFTEKKLLELAKTAKDMGIELFVLDDGWFGTRDDDTTSLGDWIVNTKKLPSGITKLSEKIHDLGLMFGLWVEPEMVSRKSLLFEKHPDWMISIPQRAPSVGRNQFILDLTRQEVRDYLVESLCEVFRMAHVDYVKWDMNRTFSDIYSIASFSMTEFNHRYVQGLYEVFDRLTKCFPRILFESCASGGNRFDLGILCYMPQIWTSDNTDALCRTLIQSGTSYGYPVSTMGAHVSESPNHQTLRHSDIESRFNVAAFGIFGYELDLTALSLQEKTIVKAQVEFYKEHRHLLQFGKFFRLEEGSSGALGGGSFGGMSSTSSGFAGSGNKTRWLVTNDDFSEMIVLDFQALNKPNPSCDVLKIPFARPNFDYEVIPRQQRISLEVFGSLINRLSPVNMSKDSKLKKVIEDSYTLKSEDEHYIVSGDVLSYAGLMLNPQFGGTGYNDKVRVLGDFGSRLYYIKRV